MLPKSPPENNVFSKRATMVAGAEYVWSRLRSPEYFGYHAALMMRH